MSHDIFISYSTVDKSIAEAICHYLEAQRIRCWISPRDVPPGANFAGTIVRAIKASRGIILVYSQSSNRSVHVLNEVNAAVSAGVMIIPFRIHDVALSEDMQYYLGAPHWLDALTPPIEEHLDRLCERMKAVLAAFTNAAVAPEGRGPTSGPARAPSQIPKTSDQLSLRIQDIHDSDAQRIAGQLASIRSQLAIEIEQRAFEKARTTVAQLLGLQPNDADARAAKNYIEREAKKEAEAAHRLEVARQRTIATLREQLNENVAAGEYNRASEILINLRELDYADSDTRRAQLIVSCKLAEHERIGSFEVKGASPEQWATENEGPTVGSKNDTYRMDCCMRGRQQNVLCVASFPDGTLTASGAADGTVYVWDMHNWQIISTLTGHTSGISSLALSARGRYVISGDSAGYIAAWDNQTRKCIRLLYDSESENLRGMVLMPDGRRIVSASRGLNVWDLVTRDLLHSFEFRYDVNCIAAHPDGHSVVVGFDDCTTVWNLSTHLKTHEISAGAKSLAVLPNGRVILVHPGEDGVSLGNLNSGSILSQLDLFDAPVTSVAIVPDGRRAVFGMKDGQVSICDLHCGVVLHTFPRGNGYHTEAAT